MLKISFQNFWTIFSLKSCQLSNKNYFKLHSLSLGTNICMYACVCMCIATGSKERPTKVFKSSLYLPSEKVHTHVFKVCSQETHFFVIHTTEFCGVQLNLCRTTQVDLLLFVLYDLISCCTNQFFCFL
jgi:hypothetical protein